MQNSAKSERIFDGFSFETYNRNIRQARVSHLAWHNGPTSSSSKYLSTSPEITLQQFL